MMGMTSDRRWEGVGSYVEAYESAVARDGRAEVGDFAPPADHPERLSILCELVRVDLEHGWGRCEPRRLENYRDLFPALFDDSGLLHAMAFEEYRLRLQAGERPTPDEYRQRFGVVGGDWPSSPAPEEDKPGLERAASAYRAYREGGAESSVSLGVILDDYRVSADHASFVQDLDRIDPHAAERLADALVGLPKVGGRFLGFELCGELGRGAFGRVYLARQGDLANRLVALKVSADVAGETHALSQLQHTNIVPVYSIHRRGPLQAVCMPYLGSTTLADTITGLKRRATLPDSGEALLSTLHARQTGSPPTTVETLTTSVAVESEAAAASAHGKLDTATPQLIRLRGLGYVAAVLCLMERVADGLAHAHERGILHGDLKPANILFADDGEPLLLDFNLATDTKVRVRASTAFVGGTLPYMAPEHLDAFRAGRDTVDARSDVYSLGVILYELLTGRHPFLVRRGPLDDVLPALIADRRGPRPDPRAANATVSPAVTSIVAHCLEPDPARRYQSARELQEDLRRQLVDLPLRHAPETSSREKLAKWSRRHPRLTSSTTVALVAGALLIALSAAFLARHRRYQAAEAAGSLRALADERNAAVALLADPNADPERIRAGEEICRSVLDRYRVLDDPEWDSKPLVAALAAGDRERLRDGLGELLVLSGRAHADATEAARRLDAAEACYGRDQMTRPLALARAELARRAGKPVDEVRRLQQKAESIPCRTVREKLLSAAGRIGPQDRRGLNAFLDAIEGQDLQDSGYANWVVLGNWCARLGRLDDAAHAYGVAVALAPREFWPRFNRGALFLVMNEHSRALEDFEHVLALRPDHPLAYLNRGLAKLGLGDAAGAVEDLTRCLGLKHAPTRAWFIRARAKARLGDAAGSAADRGEGLRRTPEDEESFVARGLARLPADPRGALVDFDAALGLNPRYVHALQDKASVLSENLGRPAEALEALGTALEHHPTFAPALAGRAVLHARLGRRAAAHSDIHAALDLDDRPTTAYQAACVFALTSKLEPADRADAFRLLSTAIRGDDSWLTVAIGDPDLAPLRDRPEFRELLQALTVVQRARASK